MDICLERKIRLKQSSKSPQVLLQSCNHTHAILLLLFYFIFVNNLLLKQQGLRHSGVMHDLIHSHFIAVYQMVENC